MTKTTSTAYSPDDLDGSLFEAGDLPVAVANPVQKTKGKQERQRVCLNKMSPQELSEYLLASVQKRNKNASLMELEDLRPPGASLCAFDAEKQGDLSSCVKAHISIKTQLSKGNCESPVVVIISSSAIRAMDLIRQLGPLRSKSGVGKCFAKHFKIEEQLKFFDQNRPGIVIGTPHRLAKLFASEHVYFNFAKVALCVIDTHRDLKQRNIFEIPETCSDLLDFYTASILPGLRQNGTKLVFF